MIVTSDLHLVVVRGTSASGKTTVARALQLGMGRGTANVGQDHLRRVVLREHDVPGGDNIRLIESVVRECLALGHHTILEGILWSPHYGTMLRRLVASHAGPAHVVWLAASLEQTLERHHGRPLAAEVTDDQIRRWYHPDDLLGIPGEVVLDAHRPLDEVVADLQGLVGPVAPRPDPTGARFL